MKFDDLKNNWNQFGVDDPLWAILTADDVKNNKWDLNKFFQTGKDEIKSVLSKLNEINFEVAKNIALDFGCGVGRLSHALADVFKNVEGVDVAESMVNKANEMKNGKNIEYHLNTKDDLSIFNDRRFDFIYSNITLQHMHNRYSKKYIKEFVRILNNGGVLVFQIPSNLNEKNSQLFKLKYSIMTNLPEFLKKAYRKLKYKGSPVMEMHPIHKDEVLNLLQKSFGDRKYKVHIEQDHFAGENMDSFTYYIKALS